MQKWMMQEMGGLARNKRELAQRCCERRERAKWKEDGCEKTRDPEERRLRAGVVAAREESSVDGASKSNQWCVARAWCGVHVR